jgi:hypothetical protein
MKLLRVIIFICLVMCFAPAAAAEPAGGAPAEEALAQLDELDFSEVEQFITQLDKDIGSSLPEISVPNS